MFYNGIGPAHKGEAGAFAATRNGSGLSENGSNPQGNSGQAGSLGRRINIRRQGTRTVVEIEPHPRGESLNRSFDSYPAALGYATGTMTAKGWPINDMAKSAPTVRDPRREAGRPVVHIEAKSGRWVVTMSPRPWGWTDTDKEFFGESTAHRYAEHLRAKLREAEAKEASRRSRMRAAAQRERLALREGRRA